MTSVPPGRLSSFGTSIFAEITAAAMAHDAVNLGQGFPSFDGPEAVRKTAAEAIMGGRNQYAPLAGERELRRAVADWMLRTQQVGVDPESEITIVAGATAGLVDAMLGLVHHGDEVLIVEPAYDAYEPAVIMAGGVPRRLSPPGPDYRLTEGMLADATTPRTRFLLVNSPNNPTGRVYDDREWEAVESVCRAHDLILLSDEVYERLVFDPAHHRCPLSRPGLRSRTVTISSIGKTFSLTGWKIGWTIASPELSERIREAHQFTIYSVATPLQIGAAAALDESEATLERFQEDYLARRDLLFDGLQRVGLHPILPEGTFFMLADIERLGVRDDRAFCERLIEEIGVAAIPCSAFQTGATSGPVRFAFCHDRDRLLEGIRRLEEVDRILP